jgi:hypothetical protein
LFADRRRIEIRKTPTDAMQIRSPHHQRQAADVASRRNSEHQNSDHSDANEHPLPHGQHR